VAGTSTARASAAAITPIVRLIRPPSLAATILLVVVGTVGRELSPNDYGEVTQSENLGRAGEHGLHPQRPERSGFRKGSVRIQ
jgi:hypothetical protein